MDLMTLAAKITLDDSSYTKGIKNAETMGQQLAGKMSAMTVAVGNIAADMIKKGVSAINNVISGAIDGYANYQQLIGGVETLFKTSADKVANYAKQSFKNTGLSANEYMETVTSFSASLLQGLGGNTEAAADIANTAVQDMADNANKMGTDIGSIQAAYMGFAKQNYTMLDNLKLGYGGTASEMVRLINDSGILEEEITDLDGITFDQLVEAIHVIQTEMGITGTTAKEAASTISGSKASLSAAWQDLLSAVGGEGDQARMDEAMENFKTSFTTYMENFIPTLVTTISNSGSLVTAIADAISDLPTDLLSKIGEQGLSAGTEMIGGVGKIAGWLIDSLVNMFQTINIDSSKVTEFGNALGTFIGDTVAKIATDLPTMVEGVVNLGFSLAGGLIEGLFKGLFGDDSEIQKTEEQYTKSVAEAERATTKAQGILNYMDELVEKYGDAVTETTEWQTAEKDLEGVLGGAGNVFESYGSDVQGAINKLKEMSEELRKLAVQQALQEKLDSQYKLLGEYTVQKYEAEAAAGEARNQMGVIESRFNDLVGKYATELDKIINAEGARETLGENNYVAYQMAADAILEAFNSGDYGSIADMMRNGEFDSLITSLKNAYNQLGIEEEKRIWGEDGETGVLIDPDVIEGLQKDYQAYASDLAKAKAELEEANSGISTATAAIARTEAAASRAAQELNAAASAASGLASALSGATAAGGGGEGLNSDRVANTAVKSIAAPRAIGMDFVPFTGFKAELHRGEAILTAEENAARRNGRMDATEFAEIMEDALITAMNRVNVYMSGEKVGDLTTKQVRNNINASSYSRQRSLGG